MMQFFRHRKARKTAIERLRQARYLRNVREDLMSPSEISRIGKAETEVRSALDTRNWDAMVAAGDKLSDCVGELTPARRFAGLRENFEILVVALAVAMAFRTYFLQPFKIPTGSMQPTLWGIQVEDCEKPGISDYHPLRAFKWLITGKRYLEVKAKCAGSVWRSPPGDARRDPVDQTIYVLSPELHAEIDRLVERRNKGRRPFDAADDMNREMADIVVRGARHQVPRGARMRCNEGGMVAKGEVLWAGYEVSGDHVFVDRVSWNLRAPRPGEIVVFGTDGINIWSDPPVPPGTHYIKRLVGIPGDEISLADGKIFNHGTEIEDPRRIAIRRYPDERYLKYAPIGFQGSAGSPSVTAKERALVKDGDTIRLAPGEFFALGDNTGSSLDGRFWGTVPQKNLVGPSLVIYWPFSKRWGLTR